MPSNAPAMRKAGPITSAGWPRLQPGATRARTPGTAAPAGSDCFPLHHLRSTRSAPSPGHQIDIRPRLKERIGRGIDTVDPRNGIKNDALLLRGVVRSDCAQIYFAEGELRAILGPAKSGIISGVAVPSQLYNYTKPDRLLRDPSADLV